jgi:hypothetical protein
MGARALDTDTLKKIIQTVKRFLTWLKMKYPRNFRRRRATGSKNLPPRALTWW